MFLKRSVLLSDLIGLCHCVFIYRATSPASGNFSVTLDAKYMCWSWTSDCSSPQYRARDPPHVHRIPAAGSGDGAAISGGDGQPAIDVAQFNQQACGVHIGIAAGIGPAAWAGRGDVSATYSRLSVSRVVWP